MEELANKLYRDIEEQYEKSDKSLSKTDYVKTVARKIFIQFQKELGYKGVKE